MSEYIDRHEIELTYTKRAAELVDEAETQPMADTTPPDSVEIPETAKAFLERGRALWEANPNIEAAVLRTRTQNKPLPPLSEDAIAGLNILLGMYEVMGAQ